MQWMTDSQKPDNEGPDQDEDRHTYTPKQVIYGVGGDGGANKPTLNNNVQYTLMVALPRPKANSKARCTSYDGVAHITI